MVKFRSSNGFIIMDIRFKRNGQEITFEQNKIDLFIQEKVPLYSNKNTRRTFDSTFDIYVYIDYGPTELYIHIQTQFGRQIFVQPSYAVVQK